MLYTRKGDSGTTKLFNCAQGERVKKSDFVFEVLGTIDELNSSVGYAKTLSIKSKNGLKIDGIETSYEKILEKFQQYLFCIQAELGGGNVTTSKDHIDYLEKVVDEIEKILPPITSFIVSGGGETGAYLDVTRTITRRAERQLVMLKEKNERPVSDESAIFLNRLSSALYAMARFANYQSGFQENHPDYK